MPTVKLPGKHARDWFDRMGEECAAELISESERTITLRLSDRAAADLRADAEHYRDFMSRADTGDDIDYRSPAKRCLAAMARQGV